MSDRSYRGAWPRKKVISHIRKRSGSHFDPKVVDVFLNMMEQENDNNEAGDIPYSKII
jgi:HD-GYP domain-containing protein (c-di-GMP phosphodiesterase class II)